MLPARKKNFFSLHRKFTSFFLIVAFLVSSFVLIPPKQANAQWAVIDPANLAESTVQAGIAISQASSEFALSIKEYVGDGIMWFIAKVILQRMTESIVSWINSGFNGNPAFIQNPGQFFTNVGDQAAGQFILNDPSLNFLCNSFGTQLRISLNNLRQQPYQNVIGCTLTSVIGNIDAFTSNFENGGWVAWNTMTTQPQNNPYGAYLSLLDEATYEQDQAVVNNTNQLNWGNGFLSSTDVNGNIQTPGSVIVAQLNGQLKSAADQLGAADEINEVLGALMIQLTSKALGSVSGGLLGLGSSGQAGSVITGLDDGGAGIRAGQNLQIPPQGTCSTPTPGTLNPDGSITGGAGGACSTPPASSYLQGFGGGYLTVPTPAPAPAPAPAPVPAPTPAPAPVTQPPVTPPPTTPPATFGDCPGFTCATGFATGLKDAAGTACMATGHGQVFTQCTAANCQGPGFVQDPTTGQWGQWTTQNTQAQIQCGQCKWASATCNTTTLQNCTMSFTQQTNSLCKG
jgi:hypothetical protein